MARQKQNDPITFDTLSYAKKLQAAGFTQEQAEVQAETFLAIVQEQLVSKRDIKELESEIKRDHDDIRLAIENVKKELKVDVANVQKDLKVDIANVQKDLEIKIEKVRLEVKNLESKTQTQIELLRRDLKIWFGGMLVVAVSVLSGMMTLIVHLAR